MSKETQHTVKELLDRALDLDADERSEFLERECSGNDQLRAEVEDLIRAHAARCRLLESPALEIDVEEIAR